MLLYTNHSVLRIIAQVPGSIFFRTDILVQGAVLGLVTAALQAFVNSGHDLAPDFPHHYGMHALGTVVGFAVVFRTTFSWHRYWEAITQLHMMYSKWEDSYSQLLAFASLSIEKNLAKGTAESAAKSLRLSQTCDSALHLFSLMSAFAADRLVHGDCERMHQRQRVGKWRDQIITRRGLRITADITGATKMPNLNISKVSQRSTRSWKEQVCNDWASESYNVFCELPQALKGVLESSHNRASVVMNWLIHDMGSISSDLEVAPPIQSRMYQELSNGMLGFSQAMKIADVPFPFPFAQMLSLLLICFVAFIPVYVVVFTQSLVGGPILSFLLFEGIWGLNELAKEIETPFGTDINHIPLEDFHQRFLDSCADMHRAHMAKVQSCSDGPNSSVPKSGPSLSVLVVQNDRRSDAGSEAASEVSSGLLAVDGQERSSSKHVSLSESRATTSDPELGEIPNRKPGPSPYASPVNHGVVCSGENGEIFTEGGQGRIRWIEGLRGPKASARTRALAKAEALPSETEGRTDLTAEEAAHAANSRGGQHASQQAAARGPSRERAAPLQDHLHRLAAATCSRAGAFSCACGRV